MIRCLSGGAALRQPPHFRQPTPAPREPIALAAMERTLCRCPVCGSWGDVEGDPCGTCDGLGWVPRRDLPRLWERARRHGHRCRIPPPSLPDITDPRAITFDVTVTLHDGTYETPWVVALPNGPTTAELVAIFCDTPEGRLFLLLSPKRRAQLAARAAEAWQDAQAAA